MNAHSRIPRLWLFAFWFTWASCSSSDIVIADIPPDVLPKTESHLELCNNIKSVPQLGANSVAVYAEHKFVGLSAIDISALVTAIVKPQYELGDYVASQRLDYGNNAIMVKDEWAAFLCGVQSEPLRFESVTFVLR